MDREAMEFKLTITVLVRMNSYLKTTIAVLVKMNSYEA